jgi:hypothetical protein
MWHGTRVKLGFFKILTRWAQKVRHHWPSPYNDWTVLILAHNLVRIVIELSQLCLAATHKVHARGNKAATFNI